ncbi:MAG: ribonuclease P protein component [Betaproteobacteria bacterium]
MSQRSRTRKLSGRKEFGRVLGQGQVTAGRYFVIRSCPNERDSARLGIVAARKAIRRAIDRNTSKRLVREAFRRHEAGLAGFDVVVLCRTPVAGKQRALARAELSRLLPAMSRNGKLQGNSA